MLSSSPAKKPKPAHAHSAASAKSLSPAKVDLSLVECPLCAMFFPANEIEEHAAVCMVCLAPPNTVSVVPSPQKNCLSCPVCFKEVPSDEIGVHADACAERSQGEIGGLDSAQGNSFIPLW